MNTLTITGNLGSDPELRFTANGQAVANLRIADTPRRKNAAGEWEDGETLWMGATVWGCDAEAVAENLRKGDRVVASGRLGSRTWDKDGQTRTSIEMTVDHIGKVAKAEDRISETPSPF
jgi:single-strand DNA-binding protein